MGTGFRAARSLLRHMASPAPGRAPRLGTHDGNFHCDEALACALLRVLPRYRVRTPPLHVGLPAGTLLLPPLAPPPSKPPPGSADPPTLYSVPPLALPRPPCTWDLSPHLGPPPRRGMRGPLHCLQ